MSKTVALKTAGPAGKGLEVTAKRDGFRRAGREWTGTTVVSLSDLSPEQREQLEGEPMLVVREVDIPNTPTPPPAM
jgi:hypothetical protein